LFFDERFNFIGENSNYQRVNSANNSNATLNLSNIKAPKNGYVYIYLSNEIDEPVYFDNFRVTHVAGHIQEESHYYAYGLKIAGISSRAFTPPSPLERTGVREQYQGEFADFEEELDWNDFALRSYDPQLGRWLQQDPYDEFSSPYVGMGNDPANLTDPSGGMIDPGAVLNQVRCAGEVVFKLAEVLPRLIVNGLNIAATINSFNQNKDFISKSLDNKFNNNNVKQSNSNTAEADSNNGDEEWKPLSKEKFKEYYKEKFGKDGEEDKLGKVFENLFYVWADKDPVESYYKIEPNDDVFGDGLRNTKPDFIGKAELINKNRTRKKFVDNAHWYELKQKGGGLYKSTQNEQIISHMNNLLKEKYEDIINYANYFFKSKLTLITTSDVKYSPSIGNHSNKVLYEHRHAEYRKTKNGWEFRFNKVIGRNF
jgi:RHS repeat-associated protein